MTGLTFLQGCLLVALSLIVGAQGASATGAVSGMQPQVELHRSIVNGARLLPSEPLVSEKDVVAATAEASEARLRFAGVD